MRARLHPIARPPDGGATAELPWSIVSELHADRTVAHARPASASAHREPLTARAAKNYDPLKRPRRQDWDGELVENGAFYMTTKECLMKHKCRLGEKMVLLEMEEHTFTELDSLVDWLVVTNMSKDFGFAPPKGARGASSLPPAAKLAAAALLSACVAAAVVARRK